MRRQVITLGLWIMGGVLGSLPVFAQRQEVIGSAVIKVRTRPGVISPNFFALSGLAPEASQGVGLNTPDLFKEYLGTAFGAKNIPGDLSRAVARKNMADARQNAGAGYLRLMASGYGAWELERWLENPDEHWGRFDLMMADLGEFGLKIIPVLAWNIRQFPDLAGETIGQFMTDPLSKSRQLLERYLRELVERYKDNPAILFWELTNEWNLQADLDLDGLLGPNSNFTTDQLVEFCQKTAVLIREVDSQHKISSGFALPRFNAERMRRQPMWSTVSPEWSEEDSLPEFVRNIVDLHRGLDIVSVHFYNGCVDQDCRRRENEKFGFRGRDNVDLLELLIGLTRWIGKELSVGEFNDVDPTIWTDSAAPFASAVLKKVEEGRIKYALFWCWEFYQNDFPEPQPGLSIEPGLKEFDAFISRIRQVNDHLGLDISGSTAMPDLIVPQVIIAVPYDGRLTNGQTVKVLASDNQGVARVQLFLDEILAGESSQVPYQFLLGQLSSFWGEETHWLKARAYDSSGNYADFSCPVRKVEN